MKRLLDRVANCHPSFRQDTCQTGHLPGKEVPRSPDAQQALKGLPLPGEHVCAECGNRVQRISIGRDVTRRSR
jgi:hypothetical protein